MHKALKTIPNKLDKSILLTLDKPYFSLIWLHGLGDTSAGFLDFFQDKRSPVFKGARVKLLHAPIQLVTINGGASCPSWYDIKALSGFGIQEKDRYDLKQIQESLNTIEGHVSQEIKYWKEAGVPGDDAAICQRIFIGGFSQGCAMSLCYGLTSDRLLAGIVGFSGMLFEHFGHKNKEKIPMLVYHGDSDSVLNYEVIKPFYAKHLQGLPNFKFTLIEDLPHGVHPRQISESTQWMLEQLKKNDIKPV